MDNTEELLQESDFRFVSDNEEEAEIVYERSVFKNLKKKTLNPAFLQNCLWESCCFW